MNNIFLEFYKTFFYIIFKLLNFYRKHINSDMSDGIIFPSKKLFNNKEIITHFDTFKLKKKKKIIKIKTEKYIFKKKKNPFIKNYLIQTIKSEKFSINKGYFFYNKSFFFEKGSPYLEAKLKNNNQINFNNYYENSYFVKNNFKKIYFQKIIKPKKKYDTVINLSSHNNTSYFHWIVQPSLKTISSIRDFNKLKKKAYFYISPIYKNKIPKFIIETLKLLKIKKNQLLFEDCIANKFYSLVQDNQYNLVDKKHVNFLRNLFILKKKNKKKVRYDKIFISRKFSKRALENDDEIYSFLKEKHGFRRIFLENLSIKKQVEIFYNAKIVIATHGAGSLNMIFSNKNSSIFEIFPNTDFYNESIYNICNINNINYGYIIGSKLLENKNFQLSLNKLEQFFNLKKVKQIMNYK